MRIRSIRSVVFLLPAFGAASLYAHAARAQQMDVNPPLPNVLILLDTSGSMEKMLDGQDPENESATCSPGVQSSPNRWGIAVQALTGSVAPYFSCLAMPRSKGSRFDLEYSINGLSPYDVNYFLPFHRPVSGADAASACMFGPGTLPGDSGGGVGTPPIGTGGFATDFPANAIITKYASGQVGACNFQQYQDGILDSARDMVRFGLMTFDSDTLPGVGVSLPGLTVANTPSSPFDGQWSYFDGWNGAGTPVSGRPADCSATDLFEVGARNPAAPPWEGRLMTFPTPSATISQIESQNDQVQLAVNAMRPYGATPTAGMFSDARYYLWYDPAGPQKTDPFIEGNCRDEYIIHITDGAPNLDLRPSCGQTPIDPSKPGSCPYQLPEDIAANLALGSASQHPVKTFVIGFAVSSIMDGTTPVQCSTITPFDPRCTSNDPTFAPCCELQKIAFAGGTGSAYFADTAGDLNKALAAIIASIAQNVTTRTTPAYSPVVSSSGNTTSATNNASLFLSSFAPIPGKPWTGDVQRERFQCTFNNNSYTVPPPVVDPLQGDDFAVNLNLSGSQANRQFRSVLATVVNGAYPSDGTIRPFITSTSLPGVHGNDNLGVEGGTMVGVTPSALLSNLAPGALNITSTSCANSFNTEWLSTAACRDLALNFALAQPTTDAMPDNTFPPFQSRSGFAFGDVFHSTPTVVGPPGANLSDESYQSFASLNAARPTVLYVATNDGLLHAFDSNVTSTNREKGELWAFLPPGVLYGLLSSYPAANPMLLDGPPIVKDVVFDRSKVSTSLMTASNWHTTLVAGFGTGHRGYYALDVTDPAPNTALTKGPQFLWQLTSMPLYKNQPDRELFGQHGATPAITTVFADLDGSGAHEIGVAILPGGSDGGSNGGPCARYAAAGADAEPLTGYARRNAVRCWGATGAPVAGRSLAIVRLDTGEVLRAFGRHADLPQALIDANRVGSAETPLDSPMTGIPVVYPDTPGAVTQKVFVGDADGTIWRFDLTDTNPKNWVGELYFDAYNQTADASSTSWDDGQPIQVSPVLATDRVGRVVLGFATGDQETYTATGTNYVYSLVEQADTVNNKLRSSVNWYLPFLNGERVSGPMTIFDSVFYFSTFVTAGNIAACSNGTAKMWGRDYEIPKDLTDLSQGGAPRLQPPQSPTNPPPDFIVPAIYDATLAGKLIPGVSINVTPACADTSSAITDQYTGGSHAVANYVTPGSYSLFAQVGGKNLSGNGAANSTFAVTLPTPTVSTVIDSWASIIE